MKTALLLIAHGSRQEEANADLYFFADELRRLALYDLVEPAFLDLAEPTILQGASRCVDHGAQRVILLPFFLSAGVHVLRDLQEHAARLQHEFPAISWVLAEPLGRHPLLVEIAVQRAQQAEGKR